MIFLTNISPSKNQFRQYLIERENNLVNVKWGRTGFQQSKLYVMPSASDATQWIKSQLRKKIAKGYNLGDYSQLSLW